MHSGASVRRALVLLPVGGIAIGLLLLPTAMVASSEAQPPELPRAFLDTTLVPPSGQTIIVPAGGDLQAALNAAQPGDVITLQAGATFRGPFTLPNKAGVGWITVRTSAPDSGLPPPGTRVSPSYAAVMPKLVVGTGVGGAIQTAAQAHHFRFIGIEVNPLAGALIYPPENYFPPSLAAVGFVDLASATTAWPRPVHTRTRPPMAPISAPTSTPSRRRRRVWFPQRSRLRTRRRRP